MFRIPFRRIPFCLEFLFLLKTFLKQSPCFPPSFQTVMTAIPIEPIITRHSQWPSIDITTNLGFVVDLETGLKDVIEIIKEHPRRRLLAHGLEILHRKIDLQTELDGHYSHPVNNLTPLAALVGVTSRTEIGIYKLELYTIKEIWSNRRYYENYDDWNASRDNVKTRVAAAHIERLMESELIYIDAKKRKAAAVCLYYFHYRTWLVSESLRSLVLKKFSVKKGILSKKEFYKKEFYTPLNQLS